MSDVVAEASRERRDPGQGHLAWEDPPRSRTSATSPVLLVAGFEGPLDWLLEMARAGAIDLARLSILALVEAFAGALDTALTRPPGAPAPDLTRWAAWTVMATQLAELRSRLLLPVDTPEARTAQAEAETLRRQWIGRMTMAAAADWLERRPQLGFAVFARGRAEALWRAPEAAAGPSAGRDNVLGGADATWDTEDVLPVAGGDLTDLLRACLVALRLPSNAATPEARCPPFWSVGDAAARITRLLEGWPEGATLAAFLPAMTDESADRERRCRAAVAATFAAGLELTRGGALTLDQDTARHDIHVRHRVPGVQPPGSETTTGMRMRTG